MTHVEHPIIEDPFGPESYTPEQTVLAIRALSNEENGSPVDTSSFHLSPCVCGVPMWQQPCAICGYYPMGSDAEYTKRLVESRKNIDPRMAFIRAVDAAENIAVWYVSGWRKTSAWGPTGFVGLGSTATPVNHAFRRELEHLEAQAESIPCASPADIFDYVIIRGIKLPRFHKSDLNTLDVLDGYPGVWIGDTLTRNEAGKIRRLQDDGLVSMDEYLKVTDAGKQVLSDYALEFLDQ